MFLFFQGLDGPGVGMDMEENLFREHVDGLISRLASSPSNQGDVEKDSRPHPSESTLPPDISKNQEDCHQSRKQNVSSDDDEDDLFPETESTNSPSETGYGPQRMAAPSIDEISKHIDGAYMGRSKKFDKNLMPKDIYEMLLLSDE